MEETITAPAQESTKNPLNVSDQIHETLTVDRPGKYKKKTDIKYKYFTKEEKALLADTKYTAKELSKMLGRSKSSIENKRLRLSTTPKSFDRHFTEEQVELIRNTDYSDKDLAKYMNRKVKAIAMKRYFMGIKVGRKPVYKSIPKGLAKSKPEIVPIKVSNKIESPKQVTHNQIELNINGMYIYIPQDTKSIVISGNNYNITR